MYETINPQQPIQTVTITSETPVTLVSLLTGQQIDPQTTRLSLQNVSASGNVRLTYANAQPSDLTHFMVIPPTLVFPLAWAPDRVAKIWVACDAGQTNLKLAVLQEGPN